MSEKAKRAPATYECKACQFWCYEGKSEKNFKKLKEEFPLQNLKMEATRDDHIDPIISLEDGFVDWNNLVERMFCPEENWQKLCKPCHDVKTKAETKERKKHRDARKKK